MAFVALGLAGHLAAQLAVLDRTIATHRDWARTAAELHHLGVRPPCLLTGHDAIPIAFCAGCSSAQTRGHNADTTRADLLWSARQTPVAALARTHGEPPAYALGWLLHPFGGLRLYVDPAARKGVSG
jgi:hypothetical protein